MDPGAAEDRRVARDREEVEARVHVGTFVCDGEDHLAVVLGRLRPRGNLVRRGGVPREIARAPRAEEDVVLRDGRAAEAPVGGGGGVPVVGRDPGVVAGGRRVVDERERRRRADAAVEAGTGRDGERQRRVRREGGVVERDDRHRDRRFPGGEGRRAGRRLVGDARRGGVGRNRVGDRQRQRGVAGAREDERPRHEALLEGVGALGGGDVADEEDFVRRAARRGAGRRRGHDGGGVGAGGLRAGARPREGVGVGPRRGGPRRGPERRGAELDGQVVGVAGDAAHRGGDGVGAVRIADDRGAGGDVRRVGRGVLHGAVGDVAGRHDLPS